MKTLRAEKIKQVAQEMEHAGKVAEKALFQFGSF